MKSIIKHRPSPESNDEKKLSMIRRYVEEPERDRDVKRAPNKEKGWKHIGKAQFPASEAI